MARVFDSPIHATDQSFERTLNAGLPVVAIFGNGRALPGEIEEALNKLARDEAGRMLVVRVDTQDNPQTAKRLNVTRTPLLIGFQGSEEVTRAPALTASAIQAHAQFTLGRGPKPSQPTQEEHPAAKASPADSAPIHVTDASFQRDVLEAPIPVLVDFWAPWCGPCHVVAPMLEKLAREYAGRLRIAKVDVDENPRYASQYGVQGIPTLLMVRNGRPVDRIVGARPEPELRAVVERFLGG